MIEIVAEYSKLLKELGIDHSVLEHPELKTSAEVVGHLGLRITDALPTLLMKADGEYISVVRRGGTQLDFKLLKKTLGVNDLRMATPEEFMRFTGLPVGAAQVYTKGIRTYLDKRVLEAEYLLGGSGSFLYTVKYKTEDLLKIPNSAVIDVATSVRKRVYSGIRATGRLHLGNYLGAVKGMLELQDEYDCVFSVVDLHAITTPYETKTLKDSVRNVLLDFLGAGLDPKKCKIEIQSKIAGHTELAYLLSTIYPVARLEDLPTYKEKRVQHPKYVNMGLLYYPVLMSADILLYKGELVPVGIDQEPHLEVAREIARKFNGMFGETFPEPQRFATQGEYVPSLAGSGKMSKSIEGSFITLGDDLETIRKRLAKAPTDSGVEGGELPVEGGVANLFKLGKLFFSEDVYTSFVREYEEKKIKYVEMKYMLADAIFQEIKPIQEKRKTYEDAPELVDALIDEHTEKCRELASVTMREVKTKMGLL
jgi:tryptophanyl-tRNA synthetase